MMRTKHWTSLQIIFAFLLAATVLFGPTTLSIVTAADSSAGNNTNTTAGNNANTSVGNTGAPGTTMELANPLKAKSIDAFILSIIEVIMVFLIPIIVLYIMYAGFLFVTARGNATQIADAKRALLYAIIGGVIVVGAKLIIDVIQGTVDAFKAAP